MSSHIHVRHDILTCFDELPLQSRNCGFVYLVGSREAHGAIFALSLRRFWRDDRRQDAVLKEHERLLESLKKDYAGFVVVFVSQRNPYLDKSTLEWADIAVAGGSGLDETYLLDFECGRFDVGSYILYVS